MEDLPRLRGRGRHRVDYRHLIDWLVRKPGALDNYRYRDDLFPTTRFRVVWDVLRELAPQRAEKRYAEILEVAAKDGEARVDETLRCILEQGETGEGKLNADAVRAMVEQSAELPAATDIDVAEVQLAGFDELLGGGAEVVQ